MSTQAYTVTRLKKAFRFFERCKSRLDKRNLPYSYLESFLKSSYYDLRIRKSYMEPIDIDCDDDSDENYSPRKRKKPKLDTTTKASTKETTPVPEQVEPEPAEPQKLVVILPLKSIPAKTFLHKLAQRTIFSDLFDDVSDDTEEEVTMVKVVQKEPDVSYRSIRTAYAHPLDCELGNNNGEPCEFCRNFTFGMFGLGLKDVTVADYGSGLQEIEGGHQSAGHKRTRICHVCCLDRQYITNCSGHKFSPLSGVDPFTFDFGKAFRSLERQENGYEQINQWCSLCLNPAFFRCSKEQWIDKFAKDIEDPFSPEASGCGLLLCDGCKALADKLGNDLARVVSSIPASEGVRADVDFLLPGSDLQRYFWE